jgi:hypothetical protein
LLLAACSTSSGDIESEELLAEQTGPKPRKASIAAVHERNHPKILECFERGAKAADGDDPADSQGAAVEVELHLPSTGTPASIRLLEPETVPEDLRICLEQALTDFEYGEAERGATYYQWLTYDAKNDVVTFSEPIDAYHRWGLTGEEIEAVVADHEPQIDECYEAAVEPPKGRVLLTLAIGSGGQVARAGIKKSTLGSETVEDCLVATAFEMEFDPPRGGGVVVFDLPFVFGPGEGWRPEER